MPTPSLSRQARLAFFFPLLLAACQSGQGEAPSTDSFEAFYVRFHQDSLYQMAHITFPLDGLPMNADSSHLNRFKWSAEDWVMHRDVEDLSGLSVQMEDLGVFIRETICNQENFCMERRFRQMDGEWHLIYFADMNKMAETAD